MSFAERVKLLKKQKGMTNDDLAAMTDIPLGTLTKILAGVTGDPKLSAAAAIAEALGTTLDFLCTGNPPAPQPLSLSLQETVLIKKYRTLDEHGREICDFVLSKEYDRIMSHAGPAETAESAAVIPAPALKNPGRPGDVYRPEPARPRKTIPLFDLPVSAGTGVYLDGDDYETIAVVLNERTDSADFALRVRGDSMYPAYEDGDTILVRRQDSVAVGELGVFIADGEGYFKKFGGDRLISLNPEYADLPLSAFQSVSCQGLVLGRLKRRRPNL